MTTASRDLEVSLARRWGIVAGMDEVGRGALAGPVAVGVALIGVDATPVPEGLTDSKALTARRREALVDPVREWALASAVGYASPQEIDDWGIIAAASYRVAYCWMAPTIGCQHPMICLGPSMGPTILLASICPSRCR